MLTSRITQTLDIPNEPGQSVTIRKMSHYQLSMSQDAQFDALAAKMKALDGAKLPDTDKDLSPEERAAAKAKAEADAQKPENKYNRLSVLKSGVTEWTYDMLPSQDGRAVGVAELDEDTAAWLFAEIIAFSIRSDADVKPSASDSTHISEPGVAVGLAN